MPLNFESDMDWHDAYLAQAKSDYAVMKRLNRPDVEYCHRLHYLQMATEKLAKAMMTRRGSNTPAKKSHAMFVRMLQLIRNSRDVRQQLGYYKADFFVSYIDSLMDLASKIERLSPDQAGFTRPNPEYPWWKDQAASHVWAPSEYNFPEFDPLDPKMVKIELLVGDLLRLAI